VLEAVPHKLGQKSKRCGTINRVSLPMLPWPPGTFPIRTIVITLWS